MATLRQLQVPERDSRSSPGAVGSMAGRGGGGGEVTEEVSVCPTLYGKWFGMETALTCPTEIAQVWVTFSYCQKARTVLGVAGASPAATARKPGEGEGLKLKY